MKQVKYIIAALFTLVFMSDMLCSCNTTNQSSFENLSVQNSTQQLEKTTKPTEKPFEKPTTTSKDYGKELFVNLTEKFIFSSGAGGWSTQLNIYSDGTFHGVYQDFDAISGDGYRGTIRYSEFDGTFVDVEKVNDYTYSMSMTDLEYVNEPDTEEIKDNIKYKYTTAYGLDKADIIYIYTPETLLSDLPEKYRLWIMKPDYKENETLGFYGLYNVSGQEGFFSLNH